MLDYTLSDGAISVSIDINTTYDPAFYFEQGQVLNDVFKVQTKEDGSTINTATLENLVLSGKVYPVVYYTKFSSLYVNPNQEWFNTFHMASYYEDANLSVDLNKLFWKEAQITFKMPKAFGLSDTVQLVSGSWPTLSTSISGTLTSDANYDYLKVKITPSMTDPYSGKQFYCTVHGTVQPDATVMSSATSIVSDIDDSYIQYNNDEKQVVGNYNNKTMYIVTDNNLDLNKYSTTTGGGDRAGMQEAEWNSPSEYIFLGGFKVQNLSPATLNGYRVTMKLDDPHLGVKAFQYGTDIKDVVIKTYNNSTGITNTYTIPSDTTKGIIFPPTELAGDEYITSVTATMVDIVQGYNNGSSNYSSYVETGNPSNRGMNYYGKLLGTPGDYSAEVSVVKATTSDPTLADPNDPTEWTTYGSVTQETVLMTDADGAKGITYNIGTSNVSLTAGSSAKTITSRIYVNGVGYKYTGLGELQGYKGVDVYVREPLGFTIDPSTIFATDPKDRDMKIYADTTPIISSVDGSKIYVIHMPNTVLGQYIKSGNTLTTAGSVNVSADISANVTTPTSNIYENQVFMVNVDNMESGKMGKYGGNPYGFFRTDDYNILSNSATPMNERHLGAPVINSGLISVIGNPDINVSTSASHGTSDFENYNPNATNPADTIINLSTRQDANYKVELSNNTGDVSRAGNTVIIPIPKIDEAPGEDFIPASFNTIDTTPGVTRDTYKFKWSASLKDSVENMLTAQGKRLSDYTIKYSTSYTSNKDDTSFVSYEDLLNGATESADIKAKLSTVRSVEVIYKNELPKDYEDSFYISLSMPQGSAATEAQGKINFYSSAVYRYAPSVTGLTTSLPVALRANTGIISGHVYKDTTRNYTLDTATGTDEDTGMANVTVRAFAKGANIDTATPVDVATTNTDGFYELVNLEGGTEYDIVFTNPKTVNTPMGFVTDYTSTHKTINDGTTWKVADITANGDGSGSVNALLQEPYKVVFDTTGNTSGAATTNPSVTTQYIYNGEKATSIADSAKPYKTGQTFKGWYYETGDVGTYSDSWTKWVFDTDVVDDTAVTSDTDSNANVLTLRAGYALNNYSVKYNMNGGSYSGSTVTPPADNSVIWTGKNLVSAAAQTVTKEGYKLTGWKVISGGNNTWGDTLITTGTTGNNGTTAYSAVAASDTLGTSITLEAQWAADDVTISYDLDGGDTSFAPATGSETGTYDGTVTNPGTPTKTGYTFDKWVSKSADPDVDWVFGNTGTKLTKANGVSISTANAGSLTLTATWKSIYYITGHDFSFGVNQSANSTDDNILDNNDLIYYGNLIGKDVTNATSPVGNLEPDETDFNSLKAAIANGNGSLGEKILKIKDTSNNTETSITVTLKEYGSKGIDGIDYISGNGIIFGIDEGTLTDKELLYRAQVDARLEDGTTISRAGLTVKPEDMEALTEAIETGSLGTFNVDVSTENGTTITIPVTLRAHGGNILPQFDETNPDVQTSNGTIAANDFIYRESAKLTVDIVKELSEVIARDRFGNNYKTSNLKVDENQLKAINDKISKNIAGTYPLTFLTGYGEMVEISVTTVSTPIQNLGNDTITAGDFTYNLNDKKDMPLTKSFAKTLAKVKAYDKNGKKIDLSKISIDSKTWNSLMKAYNNNRVGDYKLTFKTSTGESVTIVATLSKTKNTGGGGTIYKHKVVNKTITNIINRVKTGDSVNIVLWIIIAAVALISVLAVMKVRKKR
ncbi:MAG: InlB B-repeat-containing protein [Lachnospiraceae bacterium]|nr:InlB B-repeat-containing protein [Lachnospiraceae bacterium]